jgi:hypothetical protein
VEAIMTTAISRRFLLSLGVLTSFLVGCPRQRAGNEHDAGSDHCSGPISYDAWLDAWKNGGCYDQKWVCSHVSYREFAATMRPVSSPGSLRRMFVDAMRDSECTIAEIDRAVPELAITDPDYRRQVENELKGAPPYQPTPAPDDAALVEFAKKVVRAFGRGDVAAAGEMLCGERCCRLQAPPDSIGHLHSIGPSAADRCREISQWAGGFGMPGGWEGLKAMSLSKGMAELKGVEPESVEKTMEIPSGETLQVRMKVTVKGRKEPLELQVLKTREGYFAMTAPVFARGK